MATLTIKNLSKKYATDSVVVNNINASFCKNRITAIIGPNGAGKTTLFHLIAGSITPDAGAIIYCKNGETRPPRVALMLDGGGDLYHDLSALENYNYFVELASVNKKAERLHQSSNIFQRFGLEDQARKLVKKMSRGMRQRLSIAIALATDAEILLLDEPTNGLDIKESHNLFQYLREFANERHCIVIFSSHAPDTILELADHVHFMRQGNLASEIGYEEMQQLNNSAFVRRYLTEY
ncbi:MAG TPA: ABC transporter ATP-binding protein [Burkholderiaceae bacterium]|jgi:ABC-2 type transport system ATP-binding protein